jgi:hypothetical protein
VREELRAALAAVRAAGGADWLPIKSCGLRPTTARRLVRAGTLEASRVGREMLVSRASVDATSPRSGSANARATRWIVSFAS